MLVSLMEQKLQLVIESGSWRYPPMDAMYEDIYWLQVCPLGGGKWRNSFTAHSTFVLATAVESIPEIRYVNGETRYMKIQKPGNAVGLARTLDLLAKSGILGFQLYPQKTKIN